MSFFKFSACYEARHVATGKKRNFTISIEINDIREFNNFLHDCRAKRNSIFDKKGRVFTTKTYEYNEQHHFVINKGDEYESYINQNVIVRALSDKLDVLLDKTPTIPTKIKNRTKLILGFLCFENADFFYKYK